MGRKIILYNAEGGNGDGVYSTPGTANVGYVYKSTPLAQIIDLTQARYMKISDNHVAIFNPYPDIGENRTDEIWHISQATYATLRVESIVIMTIDGTDIPNNFHEDVYRLFREWYYNEYESHSAILRRCTNNI